jgi:hypothetical protein
VSEKALNPYYPIDNEFTGIELFLVELRLAIAYPGFIKLPNTRQHYLFCCRDYFRQGKILSTEI